MFRPMTTDTILELLAEKPEDKQMYLTLRIVSVRLSAKG